MLHEAVVYVGFLTAVELRATLYCFQEKIISGRGVWDWIGVLILAHLLACIILDKRSFAGKAL